MDFSFLDGILDSVFVVDKDLNVHYCNEPAATLCESSVRRLQGKPLSKFVSFPSLNWFASATEPQSMALSEVDFSNLKNDKQGKVQVSVSKYEDPQGEALWVLLIRDVTLEEVLHQKYHLQLEEKQVVIDQLKVAQAELENYSKNLEKMVEERTEEVRAANVMLNAIMDSLGQGFLVFDKDGRCSDFYTKACMQVLGKVPKGNFIWDVLSLDQKGSETFKLWIQAIFTNTLSFESLKPLGVAEISPKEDQFVNLDYFQIEEADADKRKVVVVATDVTAERKATLALEKEKLFAKMILKIVSNRRQFSRFLDNARDSIRQAAVAARATDVDVPALMRLLHTLEGEAALFSISEIWLASRKPQEVLQPVKHADKGALQAALPGLHASLAELQDAFDAYMEAQKPLLTSLGIGKGETFEFTRVQVEQLLVELKARGLNASALDWIEFRLLSKPLRDLVGHFDEAVTVLADRLKKHVHPIQWNGTDLFLRPDRYGELVSSFVHAFRNMVDHGIEPMEDRQMMGKPDLATIRFSAHLEDLQQKKHLVFEISDDGQGIDLHKLRNKLSEKGKDVSAMTDDQVAQTVFDTGVSTRDSVGEFSGRGIGMNAIKEEAEILGGFVHISTEVGKGTTLKVCVPWFESGSSRKRLAA